MKVLMVNPNTSAAFTLAIQVAADRHKAPGTEVVVTSPASGPRSIEGTYDQLLSSRPSLEVLIPARDQYDGFVIACFSDHALIHAMREMTTKPVLGILEAAVYTACMLAPTYGIVTTGGDKGKIGVRATLRRYGLADRCISIRPAGMSVQDLEGISDKGMRQRILDEARKAVEQDGAEVIVLGCAGMTGLDEELQSALHVPVIDGVVAALKLIEALVGYGLGTSKRGVYAPLQGKELLNMDPLFSKAYR